VKRENATQRRRGTEKEYIDKSQNCQSVLAIFDAVDAFHQGAPQEDDETIVIIDRLP
jgi:serine phosphatase RsbU (regulator of sigma subunit)